MGQVKKTPNNRKLSNEELAKRFGTTRFKGHHNHMSLKRINLASNDIIRPIHSFLSFIDTCRGKKFRYGADVYTSILRAYHQYLFNLFMLGKDVSYGKYDMCIFNSKKKEISQNCKEYSTNVCFYPKEIYIKDPRYRHNIYSIARIGATRGKLKQQDRYKDVEYRIDNRVRGWKIGRKNVNERYGKM